MIVDNTADDQSRPDTRQSDRSSTRQSTELDTAALDYTNLDQLGGEDDEADPQLSDNEVDQFLQSLKDPGKMQHM